MYRERMVSMAKRLVAETSDVFFWEAKKVAANLQLSQKELVLLATYFFTKTDMPPEEVFDATSLERLTALGYFNNKKEEE